MKLSLKQRRLSLPVWSEQACLWCGVCVLVLTCYSASVPSRFNVQCLCVCVWAALIAGLFLAVVTVAQSFLVSNSSGPPFSSLCFQSLRLSFLSFRKGLWELRFNFYTFSPRTLQIPGQLPPVTPLQITFSLSLSLAFCRALFLPLCPGDCVE